MTKHIKMENIKPRTVLIAFVAVALAYVAVVAILFYGWGMKNFIITKTINLLPFPAAIVDGNRIVTVGELDDGLIAIKRFYENQDFSEMGMRVDFSTVDGQKRLKIKEKKLLNKLIENKAVEKLAAQKNITITDKMAQQNVDRELERYGTDEAVKEKLLFLYGWGMEDFIENIVKPDMYREELKKNRQSTDAEYVSAKDKISQAQEELAAQVDFAEVAKRYSDGESAISGGEMGWFSAEEVMPEIAISAFFMKKGEQSDIIESPLGFHIIQVDDLKTEDGVDKIKVRQVFTKTKSFPEWLFEQEKEMNISVFLKDYRWNKETVSVEFRDQSLRDFEENLDKNSVGDISVIF